MFPLFAEIISNFDALESPGNNTRHNKKMLPPAQLVTRAFDALGEGSFPKESQALVTRLPGMPGIINLVPKSFAEA